MEEPNQGIRHVIPTIKDLRQDVNSATVFFKLDLANVFITWNCIRTVAGLPLSTHAGLRRRRLIFGTLSASEIFHEELRSHTIDKDILVSGVDAQDDYTALSETPQTLTKSGLILRRGQCKFEKSEMEFFGLVVKAIQHLNAPRNSTQLRSFLRMTSYFAQFIQDYATLVEPLRALTRKNAYWKWTKVHQACF